MEFDRYKHVPLVVDLIKKRRYYEIQPLPTIEKQTGDVYLITTIGDRLDKLAFQYYRSLTSWWLIALANPEYEFSSFYLEPGIQLRIPGGRFFEPFYLEEYTKELQEGR